MDGADTGIAGGLTTPGGPGDTGSLDLLGHKTVNSLFSALREHSPFSAFKIQAFGPAHPFHA